MGLAQSEMFFLVYRYEAGNQAQIYGSLGLSRFSVQGLANGV